MPNDNAPITREEFYTRTITVKGYRRSDGLFDMEGHLHDPRPEPLQLTSGVRPAGVPVHDMRLRLTLDETALIVDVAASIDLAPYEGCESICEVYRGLIGKRVGRGFRSTVHALAGRVKGCTHLTELLLEMGTCVIQALYERLSPEGVKPISLDGCHALDTTGPIVARYYPRWLRRPGDDPAA